MGIVKKLRKYGSWPPHKEAVPYQSVMVDGKEVVGKRKVAHRFLKMGVPKNLSGKKVLDIGCNVGAVSQECAKRGAEVFAADYSRAYVKLAKEVCPDAEFHHANVDAYPKGWGWLAKEYDIVFCLSVIKHVKKKKLAQILNTVKWKKLYFEGHKKYFHKEGRLKEFCDQFGIKGTVKFLGETTDRMPRKIWSITRRSVS